MASLLDNAASGGLLSDPRIAVLQQIFDPAVTKRAALLPMVRTLRPTGSTMVPEAITSREFGAPQIAVDMLGSALLPGAAAQGYTPTMQDAAQFSLDTMLGGGLLGTAPRNSLAANVFHGTPHKFAPEPGFPHGRPRLDKMGTGEGAQAYGPGFYTAESKGVGDQYRRDLSGFDELVLTTKKGKIRGDELDDTDLEVSKYLEIGERDAGQFKHNTVYWAKKQAERDNKIEVLKRLEEYGPDARKGYERNFGTLYKLDIPDADAAKTLDWDAPLAKQPKPIRDAFSKAMLGDEVFKDPILKELFADGVPNQHLGLFENSSGAQAFNTLAGKLGSQQAAADALREAGIPGVKYLDQGSRGAGEGSRNYSIWDQDVLDRTKMLERDGEILGLLD